MYRIVINKNGAQLSTINVSNSEIAGLYALAQIVEEYLAHSYRIMIEDHKARKYILVSNRETLVIRLIESPSLTSTQFADMPIDVDADTERIETPTHTHDLFMPPGYDKSTMTEDEINDVHDFWMRM